MVPLSETTLRYLEMSQALRAHGAFQRSSDAREYDETHFEVRMRFSAEILTHKLYSDIVRRQHDGLTVLYTRPPRRAAHGSLERGQTGGLTQHLLIMRDIGSLSHK